MTTATLTSVTRPTEDVIIGIDRALSFYEQELDAPESDDRVTCLLAALEWLKTIQSEIHRDNVANDR